VEFLIVMVLVLVVLYVVTIRPQRQRQMAQQTMIERAVVGDDVLTNGGIYGTITEAEGDDVVVEIADGVEVHMTRRGIAAVLPPEEEDEDEDAETTRRRQLEEAEAELDERVVTTEAGAEPGARDRR
jgi:preprotein translocase subunit YajC